jgi:MFS family permease
VTRATAALVACWIAFFWVMGSRSVLYSAMPALAVETGFDAGTIGLLTGTLYAGYALTLYVSGLLPFRRRTTVAAGILLTGAANVAFAGVRGLPALLVLSALGGIGIGLYLPRGTAAIIEAFPVAARRARAMGWHEVAATGGLLVGPLFLAACLLVTSWRVAVVAWALTGVLAVCVGGAAFAMIGGLFTMLPTILATGWGVSPPSAAVFTGWTRAAGLPGSALGGWAFARLGRLRALAGCYVITLLTTLAMTPLDYGLALAAAIMVIAMIASAASTGYYTMLGDAYRPDEIERVFGLIAAAASVVGTVGTPIVLGAVLARWSARAVLITMVAAPLLGLAGVVLFARLGTFRRAPLAR